MVRESNIFGLYIVVHAVREYSRTRCTVDLIALREYMPEGIAEAFVFACFVSTKKKKCDSSFSVSSLRL